MAAASAACAQPGLWTRLANDASGVPWADLTDDVDALQCALEDAEAGVFHWPQGDPQRPSSGVCAVCSLRDKRTCSVDQGHWPTQRHARAVAWAKRKLDMRSWYAAAPAPACSRTQGSQNTDIYVTEFHPLSYIVGDTIDGVLLVDSFHYFKKDNGKKYMYFEELLEQLKQALGLTFKAVCSGGGALSRPGRWAATYDQMMEHVPEEGVRFIIPIVCGNDWYDTRAVQPLGEDVLAAADDLCARMREKSHAQYAVIGGLSETWGYCGWMDLASQRQYDENTRVLIERFSAAGVGATSGAEELVGMRLADTIGHVSWWSEDIVFQAYHKWVRTCVYPVPAPARPLPPPAPEVHAPWLAIWDEHEWKYLFHCVGAPGSQWEPPPAPTRGWVYLYDQGTQRFVYRHRDTHVKFPELPPAVQEPWSVHWSHQMQRFMYVDASTGVTMYQPPPLVPDSWRAQWNPANSFWYYVHIPSGQGFTEPALPEVQSPWEMRWNDLMHMFEYVDGVNDVTTYQKPPVVPEGWRAEWEPLAAEFCYVHAASGVWAWHLAPAVLIANDVLPGDVVFGSGDVIKARRSFSRRHHPDKAGTRDPRLWDAVWPFFDKLQEQLDGMMEGLSSDWEVVWSPSHAEMVWRRKADGCVTDYPPCEFDESSDGDTSSDASSEGDTSSEHGEVDVDELLSTQVLQTVDAAGGPVSARVRAELGSALVALTGAAVNRLALARRRWARQRKAARALLALARDVEAPGLATAWQQPAECCGALLAATPVSGVVADALAPVALAERRVPETRCAESEPSALSFWERRALFERCSVPRDPPAVCSQRGAVDERLAPTKATPKGPVVARRWRRASVVSGAKAAATAVAHEVAAEEAPLTATVLVVRLAQQSRLRTVLPLECQPHWELAWESSAEGLLRCLRDRVRFEQHWSWFWDCMRAAKVGLLALTDRCCSVPAREPSAPMRSTAHAV